MWTKKLVWILWDGVCKILFGDIEFWMVFPLTTFRCILRGWFVCRDMRVTLCLFYFFFLTSLTFFLFHFTTHVVVVCVLHARTTALCKLYTRRSAETDVLIIYWLILIIVVDSARSTANAIHSVLRFSFGLTEKEINHRRQVHRIASWMRFSHVDFLAAINRRIVYRFVCVFFLFSRLSFWCARTVAPIFILIQIYVHS